MISNSEFEAFAVLDLDAVKVKLMHESGEGWSPERTAAVETEYRRFLYLAKAFPEEHKAPTEDVDTFWHYHILDTMKYAADCEHLFGHFLHHFPYAGMRGETDWQALQYVGVRTAMLYERTFGVRYPGITVEATGEASCGIVEQAGLSLEIRPTVQAGTAQAAYCYETAQAPRAGTVQAAYCYETAQAPRAGKVQAAYCYETAEAPRAGKVQAAYCYETAQAPRAGKVQAAYCYETAQAPRAGAVQAAYCYVRGRTDTARAESGAMVSEPGRAHGDAIMALLNSPGICSERPILAC